MTVKGLTGTTGRPMQTVVVVVIAAAVALGLVQQLLAEPGAWLIWVALVSLAVWIVRTALVRPESAAARILLVVMITAGSVAATATNVLGYTAGLAGVFAVVSSTTRPIRQAVAAVLVSLLAVAAGTLLVPPAKAGPALGALAGIAFVVLTASNRRQSRMAESALRAALEQRLAVEQERRRTTALEERARIARDLHDVLAHSLGGLVVQLDAVEAELEAGRHGSALTRVGSARRLAAAGLHDARDAVDALRAPATDAASDIGELIETHRSLGGVAELQILGHGEQSPETVEVLRRATQELLSNARRHAPGSAVTVALHLGAMTTLEVSTPRTSSPPSSVGGGQGLRGLRERVTAVGGRVTVDDGDPFRVTVVVPQ
jgi:signal transduction histidine kinase